MRRSLDYWISEIEKISRYQQGDEMYQSDIVHWFSGRTDCPSQQMISYALRKMADRGLCYLTEHPSVTGGITTRVSIRHMNKVIRSREWRSTTNEELGIPDATWGWH